MTYAGHKETRSPVVKVMAQNLEIGALGATDRPSAALPLTLLVSERRRGQETCSAERVREARMQREGGGGRFGQRDGRREAGARRRRSVFRAR